jgi:hypothetical protein
MQKILKIDSLKIEYKKVEEIYHLNLKISYIKKTRLRSFLRTFKIDINDYVCDYLLMYHFINEIREMSDMSDRRFEYLFEYIKVSYLDDRNKTKLITSCLMDIDEYFLYSDFASKLNLAIGDPRRYCIRFHRGYKSLITFLLCVKKHNKDRSLPYLPSELIQMIAKNCDIHYLI